MSQSIGGILHHGIASPRATAIVHQYVDRPKTPAETRTTPNETCNTEGVALRLIEGVCLGDRGSWMKRQNDGAILSFDEAQRLAAEASPSP